LNARTTKDRILSPTPLAKLGYPCLLDGMKNGVIKSLIATNGVGLQVANIRLHDVKEHYRRHQEEARAL
jgi:hypothetical protein